MFPHGSAQALVPAPQSAQVLVGASDVLYSYVYLDPANPPTEVMLQWNDGSSWEHRAYWGANSLTFGSDGTPSRRYMGPLPALGQWVQLQVPAIVMMWYAGMEGGHGLADVLTGAQNPSGRLPFSMPTNAMVS